MPRPRRPFGGGTFCPIVTLELLYSATDTASYDELAGTLAQLRDIPITRSVTNAALRAQRELAHARARFQRSVRLPDLLIADGPSGGCEDWGVPTRPRRRAP